MLVVLDSLKLWRGEVVRGLRHSANIEQLWTDAQLASAGFAKPTTFVVPEGKRTVGLPRYLRGNGSTVVEVYDVEDVVVTPDMVDAERDHRIEAGFIFQGVLYQSRQQDRENISGASIAALMAIQGGVDPTELDWQGTGSPFVWLAADNSLNPMSAGTVLQFGQAAMAHKQAHIFVARSIKDQSPIPLDYASDARWSAAMVALGVRV